MASNIISSLMPEALLSTKDVIDVKVVGNWYGEKAGVVMAIYRIQIISAPGGTQ